MAAQLCVVLCYHFLSNTFHAAVVDSVVFMAPEVISPGVGAFASVFIVSLSSQLRSDNS